MFPRTLRVLSNEPGSKEQRELYIQALMFMLELCAFKQGRKADGLFLRDILR